MTEKGLKKFLTGFRRKKKTDDEKTRKEDEKEKVVAKEEKREKTEKKISKPLKTEFKTDTTALIKPIITEKATGQQAQGCYIFEVNTKANKISIKKAIKEIYQVEPVKINIVRLKGKKVRYGRSTGMTKSRKKALVFLKKDEKIEFIKK